MSHIFTYSSKAKISFRALAGKCSLRNKINSKVRLQNSVKSSDLPKLAEEPLKPFSVLFYGI